MVRLRSSRFMRVLPRQGPGAPVPDNPDGRPPGGYGTLVRPPVPRSRSRPRVRDQGPEGRETVYHPRYRPPGRPAPTSLRPEEPVTDQAPAAPIDNPPTESRVFPPS